VHAGSYNSHKGVTRILLEAGADINARSDSVGTVLCEAERREQCSSMLNMLASTALKIFHISNRVLKERQILTNGTGKKIAHLAVRVSKTILKYRTGMSQFRF
jgi:hypothetical protein